MTSRPTASGYFVDELPAPYKASAAVAFEAKAEARSRERGSITPIHDQVLSQMGMVAGVESAFGVSFPFNPALNLNKNIRVLTLTLLCRSYP